MICRRPQDPTLLEALKASLGLEQVAYLKGQMQTGFYVLPVQVNRIFKQCNQRYNETNNFQVHLTFDVGQDWIYIYIYIHTVDY